MSEPKHIHKPTGHLVFPGGYPPEELELASASQLKARREEVALHELRSVRDRLLEESDRYVLPDRPLDEATREAWISYRAKLRDLPAARNPLSAKFPARPDE